MEILTTGGFGGTPMDWKPPYMNNIQQAWLTLHVLDLEPEQENLRRISSFSQAISWARHPMGSSSCSSCPSSYLSLGK
jgi:hypothetical protein